MKNFLPKLITALIFLLPAMAQGWVGSGGSPTGTYTKVMHNLAGLVEGGTVLPKSKGSIQNMTRLLAGEADVAPVQLDAYVTFLGKHPEAANKVEILGRLYQECVHIAVNKKGKVRSEDDLQKKGVTIAIGVQGSGTAVTWDYMRKLEPGYADASVVFKEGTRAFGKLVMSSDGGDSTIDAIMWVARPNLNDKYLTIVNARDELKMIDINDKDLNDVYDPLGKPVYVFEALPTTSGVFDNDVEVPCVDAVLVARSEAGDEFLDQVSEIVLSYKSSLLK